jgi:lipoate-protein ligase B
VTARRGTASGKASTAEAMSELTFLDLGCMDYRTALRLQRRLVAEAAVAPNDRACLMLLEHDPAVITLGRSADDRNVLASRDRLAAEGIEVHHVSRGGDVTYHGPGQLVGYPIIRLDLRGRDVHRYLRNIEEALIGVLCRFGVSSGRVDGRTGVWVGQEKIASIGIAVSRGVTYHGFALNVAPDMRAFDLIVSCGIPEIRMTSLSRAVGRPVAVAEVLVPTVKCFAEVFGFGSVRRGAAPAGTNHGGADP